MIQCPGGGTSSHTTRQKQWLHAAQEAGEATRDRGGDSGPSAPVPSMGALAPLLAGDEWIRSTRPPHRPIPNGLPHLPLP